MIPLEVAEISKILLSIPVTNSEKQAMLWAQTIVDKLSKAGLKIELSEDENVRF